MPVVNRRFNSLLVVLIAAILGAAVGAGTYAAFGGRTKTVERQVVATPARPASNTTGALSVNQIYRDTSASVVEITVKSTTRSQFPFGGSQQSVGQGSGFVYDTDGHVVTNQHVVAGGTSVTVKFQNGKSYSAKVVGSDASTDIAVLKVDAPASVLKPLTLADSSAVQIGDGVVAIGSPFGLVNSVTTGIVSGLNRTITSPGRYAIPNAIQTDAAINHGNSGGPLLDASGDVIGMNSQIESNSGANDGVGFAVPANTIRSVASQILSNGKAQHAFLGIRISTGAAGGAKVAQVTAGSPAAKAGLRSGDVITKAAGRSIGSVGDLELAIDAKHPGDRITVTYLRGGRSHTASVTLGTRPTG
jgi:putative serine protease PepD